jgi:predicted protein tyrosine phosphatase
MAASDPRREKLLFICSRNRWRSPTAEGMFKGDPRYDVRSAGTAEGARIRVTGCHLGWADRVFCMERRHAELLRERFPEECEGLPLIVLRVPDDYPAKDDPALIEHLREALAPHLAAA